MRHYLANLNRSLHSSKPKPFIYFALLISSLSVLAVILNAQQQPTQTRSKAMEEVEVERLDFDLPAFFAQYDGHSQDQTFFGVYDLLPVNDALYIGLGANQPNGADGGLAAVIQNDTLSPLLDADGTNPIDEQGFLALHAHNDILLIPGADPCCGDGWDAGNVYTYRLDQTQPLKKMRYDPQGNPYLPNTLHATFGWSDEQTDTFYLPVSRYDPDQYAANGNQCGFGACFGSIFASRDNFATWEFVAGTSDEISPYRLTDIARLGDMLVLNTYPHYDDNEFQVSYDDGVTWEIISSPQPPSYRSEMIEFNNMLITGSDDKEVLLSVDSQAQVTQYEIPTILQGMYNIFTLDNQGYLYVLFGDNMVRRTRNLTSWEDIAAIPADPYAISLAYWPAQHQIIVGTSGSDAALYAFTPPPPPPQPIANIDPTQLSYYTDNGTSGTQTLTIINESDTYPLDWELTQTVDWLQIFPTSGTVPPNQSLDVTIRFHPKQAGIGVHSTTIGISTNDPDFLITDIPTTIEYDGFLPATLTSPTPDSQMPHKDALIQWDPGYNVAEMDIAVGSQKNGDDLGLFTVLDPQSGQYAVQNMPFNTTKPFYLTLISKQDPDDQSTWRRNSYRFRPAYLRHWIEHTPTSVTLNWQPINQAGYYTVYRDTQLEVIPSDDTLLATTSSTTFTDTTLNLAADPEAHYYYLVTGTDHRGDSHTIGTMGVLNYPFGTTVDTITLPFTDADFGSGYQVVERVPGASYVAQYTQEYHSLNPNSSQPSDFAIDQAYPIYLDCTFPCTLPSLTLSGNIDYTPTPLHFIFNELTTISALPQFTSITTAYELSKHFDGQINFIFDFSDLTSLISFENGVPSRSDYPLKHYRGYYMMTIGTFDWTYPNTLSYPSDPNTSPPPPAPNVPVNIPNILKQLPGHNLSVPGIESVGY